MPAPSPTSPTLNDLAYNAYNPGGSMNTTAFVPALNIAVADNARISENVVLNLPGISYLINTSDFLNTAENVALSFDPTGPNAFSIATSDATKTSEAITVTAPFNPSTTFNVIVNDAVTTSDVASVVEA